MDDNWECHVTPLMGCANLDENHSLTQSPTEAADPVYFNTDLLVSSGQTTTGTSSASPVSGGSSLSPGGSGSTPGQQGGALSPGSTSSQGLPPTSSNSTQACCESGRPLATDPVTGQNICSCQYDSARLALSQYPRTVGVYGTPYPSTDQNPYPSIGVDSSAFYSPLSNPYGLKDGSTTADMSAWTSAGLQPTTGYYPYDPTFAAYGYGAGYDLAARRKNATRESTATLKAWLNEHKKNPYPTKGEKIMLAIITKMTLTQVSTWFANARRRLKKENKMTWEPKNKTDDDDDAMLSDCDDKDKDDMMDEKRDDHTDIHGRIKTERGLDDDDLDDERKDDMQNQIHHMLGGPQTNPYHHPLKVDMKSSGECGVPLPASKPKIWSLADTAACKTPPPPAALHHLHNQQMSQLAMNNSHHHHNQWLGNGFALPGGAGMRYGGASANGFMSNCQQQASGYHHGGSDVQTDTPPQTPPNMKLSTGLLANNHSNLVAGNSGVQQGVINQQQQLLAQQQLAHNNQLLQSSQCQSGSVNYSSNGYLPNGPSNPNAYSHLQSAQQQPDNTAFKPFYKTSPQSLGSSGGFVSPV